MSALNWFEIPALDFERARKFYSTVLDSDLQLVPGVEGAEMAFLPAEEGATGGAVTAYEGFKPSQDGTLVYLNGGADLTAMLDRVEGAGGKVAMPKTSIGENGFIALFIDTEGNKVGLHSMG